MCPKADETLGEGALRTSGKVSPSPPLGLQRDPQQIITQAPLPSCGHTTAPRKFCELEIGVFHPSLVKSALSTRG